MKDHIPVKLECIFLHVIKNAKNPYGVSIQKDVSVIVKKNISDGAIYPTLQRIERKELIKSSLGTPDKKKGWKG